jgi:hypothetical protein
MHLHHGKTCIETDDYHAYFKLHDNLTNTLIAIPYFRTRRSVARRNRIIAPPQTGIIRIIRTRKRNKRSRLSTSSSRDLDLRTRQIHLRAANVLRLMKCDGLDANEILAGWRVLGDGEGDRRLL